MQQFGDVAGGWARSFGSLAIDDGVHCDAKKIAARILHRADLARAFDPEKRVMQDVVGHIRGPGSPD